MDRTRWIIFAAIVLGVFGLVLLNNKPATPAFTGDASKIINAGPIADHVFGSNDQKVVLTEYGDFQCPACDMMFPYVKQIKEQYKDHLTFIFRNFPLTSIHPNALAASTAAEAAGLQGKFFEYHDYLYTNQNEWSELSVNQRTAYFEKAAKQVGLDLNKFKNDLANPNIDQKIARDHDTAKQWSITGTPTFVLNGQKLPETTGASGDKLKRAVEDELKKAGINTSSSQASSSPSSSNH